MIPAAGVEAGQCGWCGGAVAWVDNEAQHYCYINNRSTE